MAVAGSLLATSGAVRAWQDSRTEGDRSRVVASPFPLKTLPAAVGKWKVIEGQEVQLDPQVARLAGSVDSLIRSYFDEDTGVVVTVLVLLGHVNAVSLHTPEVCYPAVGYHSDDDSLDVNIVSGSVPAQFRSVVFRRAGGTANDRQEVFYSFRFKGLWSPYVSGSRSDRLRNPILYKVQVQRAVTAKERRSTNNPTERFLSEFLPELEKRIAGALVRAKK